MSSQDNFNANYGQYVLYYCNYENKDATLYNIDLSAICSVGWNVDYTQIVLSGWLLSYAQPSNATLIAYDLATVLAWYNLFYVIPQEIEDNQAYKISAANLALVRTDATMLNYLVFDTTNHIRKIWNGSAWVGAAGQYLSSNGGTVAGNVNITGNLVVSGTINGV